MRCYTCGCDCCPNDLPCTRRKFQPKGWHVFACAECGCEGDSLEYTRTGIDKQNKENEKMSLLQKHYVPQESQSASFNPFLKPEHLDAEGTIFTVTDIREAEGNMFSDILIDLKAGKDEFTLGVKGDSVVLSQLVGVLGTNERKWNGRKVRLYLAKERYINAADPSAKQVTKKPARPTRKPARRK